MVYLKCSQGLQENFSFKMSSGVAVFVMGPAGSGKSTLCQRFIKHLMSPLDGDRDSSSSSKLRRRIQPHLINLDPAVLEEENYGGGDSSSSGIRPSKDIRELIEVDDVMEELSYGPNGGLMFCLEYLLENPEWLTEELGEYQDEFLVIDLPGQIELYTHSNIVPRIIEHFLKADYKCCALYMMESSFLQGDLSRYFGGVLTATSAMLQVGIPHINLISKMDLVDRATAAADNKNNNGNDYGNGSDSENDDSCSDSDERSQPDEDERHPLFPFFHPDSSLLMEMMSKNNTNPNESSKFIELNKAMMSLVEEFSIVRFQPLESSNALSLDRLLLSIEMATQYSENLEPLEPKDCDNDDDDENHD